jgi:hypothetical protein
MNIVVFSTAHRRRELDAVPEDAIDEGLRQRLDQGTQRLSETVDAYRQNPELRDSYIDAVFMFGVLASASYEYKPTQATRQDLLPDWLAGAQAELIDYSLNHPGTENLLSTPFFSDDIGDRMDLDRTVHGLVRETGPVSLNARQFAAALALGAEMWL